MLGLNVLSLFDGISCGRVALERARINIDNYYASEIDKYAIQIANKNYSDIIQLGDVNEVHFWNLPKIDILIGGSPCTDLSIAKKNRTGLEGVKSNLFYKYVDALNKYKPKWFLFENVASMSKEDKDKITKELNIEPVLLNSSLVSAQQRKRLYWTNIPIYPLEDKGIYLKDILESGITNKEKSYTLTATYNNACVKDYLSKNKRTMVFNPIRIGNVGNSTAQGNRVYSIEGKSITLSANGGGMSANTGLYKIDLPDGDYTIRKLTPIECERLQTLPDGYTEGISNTQRYKCLGNGWTVDVIAHILRGVYE